MATESRTTAVKLKSSAQHQNVSSSKPKVDASALKKKVESSTRQQQPLDSKMKSVTTTVTKSEVKSKQTGSSSSSKTVTKKTTTTKVRERKVYNLPGQKHDPPEEKEPLRVFYESLSKQIPTSEMAEFWLMEHGLLSPEKAKKAFEKKQRKQKGLWTGGTPVKPSKPSSTKTEITVKKQQPQKPQPQKPQPQKPQPQKQQPQKPQPQKQQQPQGSKNNGDIKAKKRVASESDDDDDDFVLSHKRRKS